MAHKVLEIVKTYKGEGMAHSSTRANAIVCLEEAGYYPKGTVDRILSEGKPIELQTDWAFWSFE